MFQQKTNSSVLLFIKNKNKYSMNMTYLSLWGSIGVNLDMQQFSTAPLFHFL